MGIGAFAAALFIVIGQLLVGGILVVVAGIAIFLFWRYMKVEYEYVFVTDELQIDMIYSGASRKKGPRIPMSNVETVEYVSLEQMKKLREDNRVKLQDYTSREENHVTYMVRSANQEGTVVTLIEPSEKMLALMERVSPRKVHIRK